MKKIITTLIIGSVLLAGCANDDYAIEKRYYQVQKQAALIFKNPDASPQNELKRVVGLLEGFAQKYSKNNLGLEAQFTIGRLYIIKKDYEQARKYLDGMLKKYSDSNPVCSEILFLKGNSYEIQDKWESANAEYQKIIDQYPLTLRGLSAPIYLAQHYKIKYEPDKMMGAYREAVQHYRSLADKYPDSELAFTTYQLIAQCYAELKDWQAAINTFNTMIEKFSKVKHDTTLMNIAMIYRNELKQDQKAIETLNRLIKEYPKSNLIKQANLFLELIEKKK